MSRFVALAAAIALVLSGMMIGAFGTYLLLHRHGDMPMGPPMGRPGPPPFGPPGPGGERLPFTREMDMQLELSAEQRDKIHDILEDSRKEAEALRRELRPKLDAHLDAVRKRIADVLTPDQRKTFDALVKDDKRRADKLFLDGPPPPPMGPPPPRPF